MSSLTVNSENSSPKKNSPESEVKRKPSNGSKISTSSDRVNFLQPPQTTKIIGVLSELKDDIVSSPPSCSVSVSGSNKALPCPGRTSGTGDIYIEHNGKFLKASKELIDSDFYSRPLYIEDNGSLGYSTPLDVAITIEKVCSTLSRILLGLLGGVSLLNLLLVTFIHITWEAGGQLSLAEYYAVLNEISSILYSIMFPIALVSLFDWLDLAHADFKNIVNTILTKKMFFVILIYMTSYILYLLTAPYSDLIMLYWTEKLDVRESDMTVWMGRWKNLSLVYSWLGFLGWVLIAVTTTPDLFYQHLVEMKKYEEEDEEGEANLTFENQLVSLPSISRTEVK